MRWTRKPAALADEVEKGRVVVDRLEIVLSASSVGSPGPDRLPRSAVLPRGARRPCALEVIGQAGRRQAVPPLAPAAGIGDLGAAAACRRPRLEGGDASAGPSRPRAGGGRSRGLQEQGV
ncbi:MAG: hypothetical protein MZU91_07330 [Desulfosudis oleivorans]|nr:hypothetical protein [Desulfosudis oleivorans]